MNIRLFFTVVLVLTGSVKLNAQLVDTTKAGVFRLGGGLDAYYALNLKDVKSNNIP